MHRFRTNSIGIEQGEVILFSDFEHDGVMWTGHGPRQIRSFVHFQEAFLNPPMVHVALSMWDMSNSTNARADVQANEVRSEGFAILFRTWGDTKVARVRVSWLAMGDLFEEDDWRID
ncbi:MAG: H-type lectin domain-containing protein [Rhodobacterales bacterium]